MIGDQGKVNDYISLIDTSLSLYPRYRWNDGARKGGGRTVELTILLLEA